MDKIRFNSVETILLYTEVKYSHFEAKQTKLPNNYVTMYRFTGGELQICGKVYIA